jgi:hypothetical protein
MGEDSWVLRYKVREEYRLGNQKKANQYLQKMLKLASHERKNISSDIASAYAVMGEKDPAFIWLNKAYSEHDGGLILLDAIDDWDRIRADTRFAQLRSKVGLPASPHQ